MRAYDVCRPYIDYWVALHRRLHALVHQARRAIKRDGRDEAAALAELTHVLPLLRAELEHHFAEEDKGGCLEEAVSHCPRLSLEARRIEAEHPRLLDELDRLTARATAATPADLTVVEVDLEMFLRRLHSHEAAENELLRQGFGATVNGMDEPVASLVDSDE